MELAELLRHLRERREPLAPEETEEESTYEPGALLIGLASAQAAATPPVKQARARAGQRGGGGVNASGDIQQYAKRKARQMFGKGQWGALDQLIQHESGWNPKAQNPTSTAFGLGQFLDSTWANYGGKTSDPYKQINKMLRYVRDRYSDPRGAWNFWQKNRYY